MLNGFIFCLTVAWLECLFRPALYLWWRFCRSAPMRQAELNNKTWRYLLICYRYWSDTGSYRGETGALCVDPQSAFEQALVEIVL